MPAGTWITGGNWDHSLWGGELPTREWIDAVTPDHPVWINRLDGHMSLANSLTLKLAGITRATKDVAGGAIVRDAGVRANQIEFEVTESVVCGLARCAPQDIERAGEAVRHAKRGRNDVASGPRRVRH